MSFDIWRTAVPQWIGNFSVYVVGVFVISKKVSETCRPFLKLTLFFCLSKPRDVVSEVFVNLDGFWKQLVNVDYVNLVDSVDQYWSTKILVVNIKLNLNLPIIRFRTWSSKPAWQLWLSIRLWFPLPPHVLRKRFGRPFWNIPRLDIRRICAIWWRRNHFQDKIGRGKYEGEVFSRAFAELLSPLEIHLNCKVLSSILVGHHNKFRIFAWSVASSTPPISLSQALSPNLRPWIHILYHQQPKIQDHLLWPFVQKEVDLFEAHSLESLFHIFRHTTHRRTLKPK